jgi:ABC-type multidrug transport system ATPase subunit
MSTLTVYETVLYSALLRLPREMSIAAKRFRTLETIAELGLLGVKDSRVGDAGHRSISGGEKRRVSIACELVTSPSILFCDEPTSGLDAYNAHNVVESLVTLARNYNRTVVFSIHQPRSNIVALFDHLVLLAAGKAVYSGPLEKCGPYFESIEHGCPAGFNLGAPLVDLTASATNSTPSGSANGSSVAAPAVGSGYRDEEAGPHSAATDTELRTRSNSTAAAGTPSTPSSLRQKTSRLATGVRNAFGARPHGPTKIAPQLAALVDAFAASDIARQTHDEIVAFEAAPRDADGNELPDVSDADRTLRGYDKASLFTQLVILSGRAFKNLYRNPQLMAAHYAMSVVLARALARPSASASFC